MFDFYLDNVLSKSDYVHILNSMIKVIENLSTYSTIVTFIWRVVGVARVENRPKEMFREFNSLVLLL